MNVSVIGLLSGRRPVCGRGRKGMWMWTTGAVEGCYHNKMIVNIHFNLKAQPPHTKF